MLVATLFLAAAVAAPADPAVRSVELRREIVNLEGFAGTLTADGGRWRGTIPRAPLDVPFIVELRDGNVARAMADANGNGDPADDPELKLSRYPGEPAGRSFLVELREGRLVRVVVPAGGTAYRVQEVYGMLGSVEVDGQPRLLLLYDANRDGAYTRGSGDGVFVDSDGDRHFAIDVMGPDFGPFGLPLTLGRASVVALPTVADGSRIILRTVGSAMPFQENEVGSAVADLAFAGSDGKTRLLSALRGKPVVVYFWASSCETCRADADGLQAMYARLAPEHLEILGVSYDAERGAMEAFRHAHQITWPTSFSGGVPSGDPIGRAFHEASTGVYYVIDRDGTLAARVTTLPELNEKLSSLVARRSSLVARAR